VGTACTHQAPEYSWSHSASGEYLFAFDTRECREAGVSSGDEAKAHQTTGPNPVFFSCMQDRGYFLVDPATGEPVAMSDGSVIEAPAYPQANR
jgi:hypothetical protein